MSIQKNQQQLDALTAKLRKIFDGLFHINAEYLALEKKDPCASAVLSIDSIEDHVKELAKILGIDYDQHLIEWNKEWNSYSEDSDDN